MAAAVVTVIVEDILQSLEEGMKLGQQWGIEHQIIVIRDLLSSVRGVLPQVEHKYGRSLELQEWVQNLKHAAFDVEDLLEELSVEDALWQHQTKVRRLVRAIHRFKFWWRIRGELTVVASQLKHLISWDLVGRLRDIPDEIGETHETPVAIPLIGRHDEKRELRRNLWYGKKERNLPIIQVQGVGGIGKTALVEKVLSESEVSGHFDYIIWVNASPPFDESRMARDIIASLTNGVATEEENVVEEQLLVRVRKLLEGRKKYLFIRDDLSFEDLERRGWLRFRSFLWGGATGSTILVTTGDPGWIYDKDSLIFAVRSLTLEESRELLLQTAFKGGVKQITDPAKHQIAEEVAKNCDGNPLFIRAVGGYMSLQHDRSDWSSLQHFHSVLCTLFYGGYRYGHLSPMAMRYNNLPSRMKQCFGLCSLFPRGHAMDRQTLAELWIALGYIKSTNEDHRSLEDIADNYFDQLLMEELFRVKKFDTFGKVRSVVLHPKAEELVRSVAGWECHALRRKEFFLDKGLQEARHISSIDGENFHGYPINFRKLRTIIYFVDDHHKAEILCNHLIPLLRHGLARVLDVHHMNVEAVPEAVCKLLHLRYLNLSGNKRIETLPPEITGLLNLQTLKLSGCWALKELPPDMQKMVSLRHLYIDGCQKLCLMPKGLGDLKFLDILTDFILPPDDSSSVDSANLSDLCKLNDLRGSLRITNLCYSEAAGETFEIQGLLDEKSSLESLELIFMTLPTDMSLLDKLRPHPNLKGLRIHNYGATLFSKWMAYLPNLVEIALISCENCEYLPQFGHLRHLMSLTIQRLPDLLRMESGPEVSSSYDANNAQPLGKLSLLSIRDCPKLECLPHIPCLTKLTLVNVYKQLFGHPFRVASSLKTLRLENIELLDHFPEEWLRDLACLEELHIGSCPSLVSLSRGMMHLQNLESLSIWNCRELDLSKDELGQVMTELEGLKSLKFLTIYKASKMKYLPEWVSRVYTLRFLFIRSCPNLVALPQWIGSLWSLKQIELVHCPGLTSLPEWMHEFTNGFQRKLSIIGCPHLQSYGIKPSSRL